MAEAVEMKGLTRLRAPMAEAIFLNFLSMCLSQERLSSIVTPNDFAVATLFRRLFSILIFMWLFVFVAWLFLARTDYHKFCFRYP